jgi:hypothetical protein
MTRVPQRTLVGNLTVTEYLVRQGSTDVSHWLVTSWDGKVTIGPFPSLEEAMEAATHTSEPKRL